MLTTHEAKLYLAEQLPERIITCSCNTHAGHFYYKTLNVDNIGQEILETEWQQIALWVEEKMTYEQRCSMAGWYKKNSQSSLGAILDAMKADYTTRVTAMKESKL
jgi:hypothetical protein